MGVEQERYRFSRTYTESQGFELVSTSSFSGEEMMDMATTTFTGLNADRAWLIVAFRKSITDSENYLCLRSYQIYNDGRIVYKGLLSGLEGGKLLFGRQTGYERLSIEPVNFKDRPSFVICAKAFALDIRQKFRNYLHIKLENIKEDIKEEEDEEKLAELEKEKENTLKEIAEKEKNYKEYEQSKKGLKILYGYILDDGKPTIEGVNIVGSGDNNDVKMCDITSQFDCSQSSGVVSVHKDEKNYFQLIYWEFKEEEGVLPHHRDPPF